MKYVPASSVAPFSYFEILFAFIADKFLFHYTFYLTDFIGSMIIIASLVIHVFLQIFLKKKEDQKD